MKENQQIQELIKQNNKLNEDLPEMAKIFIDDLPMQDGDSIDPDESIDLSLNIYNAEEIKKIDELLTNGKEEL